MDIIMILIGGTIIIAILLAPLSYLWEKAKKDEYMGIATISLFLGYAYALYNKNKVDGIGGTLLDICIGFFVSLFAIFAILSCLKLQMESGKKQFEEEKAKYQELKIKYENGTIKESEMKRFSYLHKKANELTGEFNYKKM